MVYIGFKVFLKKVKKSLTCIEKGSKLVVFRTRLNRYLEVLRVFKRQNTCWSWLGEVEEEERYEA